MDRIYANLNLSEEGKIEVLLRNKTGHPETFFVSGIVVDVYLNLDGNTVYSTFLQPAEGATKVQVLHNTKDGPVLATLDL